MPLTEGACPDGTFPAALTPCHVDFVLPGVMFPLGPPLKPAWKAKPCPQWKELWRIQGRGGLRACTSHGGLSLSTPRPLGARTSSGSPVAGVSLGLQPPGGLLCGGRMQWGRPVPSRPATEGRGIFTRLRLATATRSPFGLSRSKSSLSGPSRRGARRLARWRTALGDVSGRGG